MLACHHQLLDSLQASHFFVVLSRHRNIPLQAQRAFFRFFALQGDTTTTFPAIKRDSAKHHLDAHLVGHA